MSLIREEIESIDSEIIDLIIHRMQLDQDLDDDSYDDQTVEMYEDRIGPGRGTEIAEAILGRWI